MLDGPRDRRASRSTAWGSRSPRLRWPGAAALFISPGTVRKHLEHIYDKLEVRTRTEAAAIYAQERLVIQSTGLDPPGARRHPQNQSPQAG